MSLRRLPDTERAGFRHHGTEGREDGNCNLNSCTVAGTYGLSDGDCPARMEAARKDEGNGWQMGCRVAMSEARFRGGVMAMVVFGVLWSQPITGSAQTSVDGETRGAQGGRRAILW